LPEVSWLFFNGETSNGPGPAAKIRTLKIRALRIIAKILAVAAAVSAAFACSTGISEEADFLTRLHSLSEDKGVTFTGEYTGEILSNLSGGIKEGTIYEGLLKLTLQLDLKKIVGWEGASIFASALYPHGNGLSKDYTGDFNILSSIDAHDSVRLFELWFQQKLFGDKMSIRIGQMSADLEFYQSVWANIFINSCYGTFPTISMGTNLPIYPFGGLGARIDYYPTPNTFVRTAVFDSNPGDQATNDQHGTRFHLSPSAGVIVIAETGYMVTPSSANKGRQESYTIGAYYDSREFTGSFVDPAHHSNGGFYAIVDRLLYRKTPYLNEQSSLMGLGGFASFSYAPPDGNQVSFYADCGLNYNGLFPGRDSDVLGLALSYTKISSDYLVNDIPVHSGHETVLEATYRWVVNKRIYIQPDFQYILDPGAFRHRPNAVVAGVRYDVTF
jgi:porin